MGHTKITIYVEKKKKKIKADLRLTYCQQAHVPSNNEYTFFQQLYHQVAKNNGRIIVFAVSTVIVYLIVY